MRAILKVKFPFIDTPSYYMTMTALLKHLLEKGNEELFTELYRGEKPRGFSFIPVLPRDKVLNRNWIVLKSPVRIFVSSERPDFLMALEEGFYKAKALQKGGRPLRLWVRDDVKAEFTMVSFRHLDEVSSDVLETQRLRFYSLVIPKPDAVRKRGDLFWSTKQDVEDYFKAQGLELVDSELKKYIVRHRVRGQRFVVEAWRVDAWFRPVTRRGELTLKEMYDRGLGWRKSQGFGFLWVPREALVDGLEEAEIDYSEEVKPVCEVKVGA